MERDCPLARNTSLQGHVDKEKAATSQLDHNKLESLIGTRILYLSIIYMEKAQSEENVLWMGGTV